MLALQIHPGPVYQCLSITCNPNLAGKKKKKKTHAHPLASLDCSRSPLINTHILGIIEKKKKKPPGHILHTSDVHHRNVLPQYTAKLANLPWVATMLKEKTKP